MRTSPIIVPAVLGLLVWTTISSSCAQTFQTSTASLTNAANPSGFGLTLTTVPAGKALVIEFLSAACSPTGAGGVVPNPLRVTTQVDHSIAFNTGKHSRTSGGNPPDPNIRQSRNQSKSDVVPYD